MDFPLSVEDVQEMVRQRVKVRVVGGGTKPALSAGADGSLRHLSGVVEYEPSEFTFTALAGTPIATIQEILATHRQYLPFDPPLVEAGATLGGTVAAGVSGPGRFRFGGVRDFLLGVQLINGEGNLIRGGGKVVKNAAGFDLPKLMVGSQGQFGILIELCCKVFPEPAAWATLSVQQPNLTTALETMLQLAASPLELSCLDMEPEGRLWLRLAGLPESLTRRIERLRNSVHAEVTQVSDQEEPRVWRDAREFAWVPQSHGLAKVPLVPRQILAFDKELSKASAPVPRRYSVGGNVAWLAWPSELPAKLLETTLQTLGLSGIALSGTWPSTALGRHVGLSFAQRLLTAFDPLEKFQRAPASAA